MGSPSRWRATREHGTAAVEFALVLPLVLLMALALVQVGLLVKDQVVVEEAARAGAREAAVAVDDQSVRDAVLAASVSLDPNDVEVGIAREGGAGTAATVTVTYHAAVEIPLVSWLFPAVVDLRGEATMRQEVG
jgi:Flp pilus assembly protein TadG